MDEHIDSFGYWLRRRRRALDLTQEELARQVSCSHFTIRKIEADERRPSRALAERLAQKLAIPAQERESFLAAARAEAPVARLAVDRQPASAAERGSTTPKDLDAAREAAGRGEWQQAFELLSAADAACALAGADLALLADCAYAAGRLDVTIQTWERTYASAQHAGDALGAAAAAVRVAMHLIMDTALLGPVRGWLQRAERLLPPQGDTPLHAWFAVARNYERLLSGDFDTARQWARRAIEAGTHSDPAAAAVGRIAEARSMILSGEVEAGVAMINEAAVAAVSGEIGSVPTGIVFCEILCAFQGVAQYDLAEEWTSAMERWSSARAVGSFHGRCRVHRAEILRLRGRSDEAEQEALRACEELKPYVRRELGWPLVELGRIRLRRGDLDGAQEAFRSAHEVGWDPQPGLALLHLARGDVTAAARSLRDALEHPLGVPSKEWPPNTELRRAPLLEAQVEVAVASGDTALARAAAEELSRIAERFRSRALSAGAALAMGRIALAEGDTAAARGAFELALQLWSEVGAPYEEGLARMGLADAHVAAGSGERAASEWQAARSAFERAGARHLAAAAQAALRAASADVRP